MKDLSLVTRFGVPFGTLEDKEILIIQDDRFQIVSICDVKVQRCKVVLFELQEVICDGSSTCKDQVQFRFVTKADWLYLFGFRFLESMKQLTDITVEIIDH